MNVSATIARAQGVGSAIALTLVSIALTYPLARSGTAIDARFGSEPRPVPFVEIIPIVVALALAVMLRPTMAQWARLAAPRRQVMRIGWVGFCLLLPLAPTVLGLTRIDPTEADLRAIPVTVLTFTAVAFVLVAALGPALGALTTAACYVALVLVQNLAPTWAALLPLDPPNAEPTWIGVPVALTVALVVQWVTGGSSVWSQHQERD